MNMIRLELDGWEKSISFSASHILPGHDKCGRLHGHNYAIHAKIWGEPSSEGVVYDFLPIKSKLRDIADSLDHRIIVPEKGDEVNVKDSEVELQIQGKRYIFPKTDAVILEIERATAEEMAMYVLKRVLEEIDFPDNITEVEIGIDESRGQGAWATKDL